MFLLFNRFFKWHIHASIAQSNYSLINTTLRNISLDFLREILRKCGQTKFDTLEDLSKTFDFAITSHSACL